MLDYGWGSSSGGMISGEEGDQDSASHHIFDAYSAQSFSEAREFGIPEVQFGSVAGIQNQLRFHQPQSGTNFGGFYEGPREFSAGAQGYQQPEHQLSLEASVPAAGYMAVPKTEPACGGGFEFSNRVGLNLGLGSRTYFASSSDDFISRLYRRSRILDSGVVNAPRCQAEGCNADLTHAKHYHRRHKVCEFHSKAATVITAGLTQRFCQQCSRFHMLSEFDNGKRSCRKRLADHNRRRRKSQRSIEESSSKSQLENTSDAANSPSENLSRSPPPESDVAISQPRASHDRLAYSFYGGGTISSTASTSSLFYPNG